MAYARIVLFCIAAAVAYGIIHDQITARLCVEYFTVAHPRLIDTDSPTVLGLFWGIVATWWVGLILGVPLSLIANAGARPPVPCAAIIRPMLSVLLLMAISAAAAGLIGHAFADRFYGLVPDGLLSRIPPERHRMFIADAFSHNASYLVGFLGGIVLCIQTHARRKSSDGQIRCAGQSARPA